MTEQRKQAIVIGGGLAGCEAAWQLAQNGIAVTLYEQKPVHYSPAHHRNGLAELVCSNSLKADRLASAAGLLKAEMERMGSLLIPCARKTSVPAGGALAVDRDAFSDLVTEQIRSHPLITLETATIDEIPAGNVVVATGPLTEGKLAEQIEQLCGTRLRFFDAAAPIVKYESLDAEKVFFAARYGRGTADYINCPMNADEFETFYDALIHAECVNLHDFEKETYFEGCMPIEEMARRGKKTMLFGPLKPVGLEKDKDSHPVAVVQLRQDNVAASMYNIVGFQTHLTWPEQRRVFSLIPGLENLKITRYGVMHRNSYLSSPIVLKETYQSKKRDDLFFAGQLTGVEGYVESCASGLIAGINMSLYMQGKEPICFGNTCVMGSQAYYITHCDPKHFQPMNANFGIMHLNEKCKKHERKEKFAAQALSRIQEIQEQVNG